MFHKINKYLKKQFDMIFPLNEKSKTDIDQDKLANSLFTLFKNTVYSIILCILWLIIVYQLGIQSYGQIGDFFGGILNPLLTFITFIAILITVLLQQLELRHSRSEFKRTADALTKQVKSIDIQNFEATFFQMVSIYNTLVNAMLYEKKTVLGRAIKATKGRECFNSAYTELSHIYKDKKGKWSNNAPYAYSELETIQAAYKFFWNGNNRIFAHYFRYLYNVIKYVHEETKVKDKEIYIRILRAQLSDQELLMIFYNCLTTQGTKLKPLVERYDLIHNFDEKHLLDSTHEDIFNSLK